MYVRQVALKSVFLSATKIRKAVHQFSRNMLRADIWKKLMQYAPSLDTTEGMRFYTKIIKESQIRVEDLINRTICSSSYMLASVFLYLCEKKHCP
ncbi:hypothetical protein K737_301057 [Holospora undulata HU1]|uniref:Uncharacterized protein n=1 Tax=Holospora undulata HU1 TaxID=1321371 RepID=A0A061JFR8_9PROT|nr:hypothetical protein K737_301057 [Holospora undulata HU1]